jgi:alginate O-acetyltransferase complex protein AlgI
MPFSSVTFLFAFLPTFLLVYHLAPARFRNAVALIASLGFYAWGAPRFLFVLVFVSMVDYAFSRGIARAEPASRRRSWLLAVAVTINLGLLFYFKYANFFVREGNHIALWLGKPALQWVDIALPMGISFVAFEEISYLVDVFRGVARPAKRLSDYALFLSLFPHSIAGPIFRWKDLEQQLRSRVHSLLTVFDGFLRFSFGLAKKVLIANNVARVADQVFRMDAGHMPTSFAWLGVLAYSLQIYFDFSGYSDMAIGLGQMIGFSFKENFDAPYTASSITEFWRRWHISLSTWLRDYLYIPLGGSREGEAKRFRNLILVFLLCGFWHGANWTFLAWGAYHGTWLVLEQSRAWRGLLRLLPRFLLMPLTFLLVMLGWVFFRADNLQHAVAYFGRLFAWHPFVGSGTQTSWGELITNRSWAYGALALIGCFAMAHPRSAAAAAWLIGKRRADNASLLGDVGRFAFALCAFSLSTVALVNAQFNPFIYFRF